MTEKQPAPEISSENIPELLPILPLFDTALYPKMVLPLVVMQRESVQLIDEAMSKDRIIGLVVAKQQVQKTPFPKEELSGVGTSALILKMAKTQDNRAQLLVQGLSRFKVVSFKDSKPYLLAQVEHLKEIEKKDDEAEALMSNLIGLFNKIVELSPGLPQEIGAMANNINEPGTLADMIASTINISTEDKQKILEIEDSKTRLKEVNKLANHQLQILERGNKIQS